MRVTQNSNFEVVREGIERTKRKLEELQHEASTLKKLKRPSDNPVGAAKILELRTEKVNQNQFSSNAQMARVFLENTEQALSDLSNLLVRVKEIAISQSSSASSSEETRKGVSEEISQLFLQALSIMNRRVGDRYILGGFQTLKPPINAEGEYQGDEGQIFTEIADQVFIAMNIPGNQIINTQPDSFQDQNDDSNAQLESSNLFEVLQKFRAALLTGQNELIQDCLEPMDDLFANLVSARSKVGARLQGLQSALSAMERHAISNASLSSSIEDSDVATLMTDLAREESVLKSSLSSAQKLIQPTLLDFLR